MFKVKKNIEDRFIKNGCIGTITLHGDTGIIQNHSDKVNYLNTDMMNRFKRGSIVPVLD
jgi:hypothetical protein